MMEHIKVGSCWIVLSRSCRHLAQSLPTVSCRNQANCQHVLQYIFWQFLTAYCAREILKEGELECHGNCNRGCRHQLRTVRVDGLKFEYQLTEDDVRKVRHGESTNGKNLGWGSCGWSLQFTQMWSASALPWGLFALRGRRVGEDGPRGHNFAGKAHS